MRKFGTQIISAVLAGCMMASVLPVSAFALETGADVENGVNAQAEAVTKIEDPGTDYTISEPGVYSMEGTYANRVIINTDGDVIIHVTGNIDYTNASATGNVALWQVVKVNELTIENENQYTVQTTVSDAKGPQLLREEYDATVNKITVSGGIYKYVGKNSAFQFSSGGEVELKNVTLQVQVEGKGTAAIYSSGSCHVIIDGGKYENESFYGDLIYNLASMTIKDAEMFNRYNFAGNSRGNGIVDIIGGSFTGKGNQNATLYNAGQKMTVTGATVVGKYGFGISAENNSETIIDNSHFNDSQRGIYVKDDGGYPKVVLNSATFQNNGCDIYLAPGRTITIADTFTDRATVDVRERTITAPRPITTSSNPVKRNLVSNRAGYRVAYDESDGHYYLTPRTAGKFTVDAEDAKVVAEIDGVSTEVDANTEIAKDTRMDLTAVAPGAGWELIGWELKVAGEDKTTELLQDADTENPWFTMPEGNVTVRALYNFVGTGDAGGSGSAIGGAIAAGIVTGAAAWGVYEAGTGIYRVINMPGIPMPSNRIELAELLWEHAGKPEPVSTALYSDIDEGDTDAQKAARWAVEQDLMKDDADNNKFNPYFPVSKLRTCLTWNAAKEKGLFAKTEE